MFNFWGDFGCFLRKTEYDVCNLWHTHCLCSHRISITCSTNDTHKLWTIPTFNHFFFFHYSLKPEIAFFLWGIGVFLFVFRHDFLINSSIITIILNARNKIIWISIRIYMKFHPTWNKDINEVSHKIYY